MANLNISSLPLYPEAKHEKMREYSDGIRIGGGLKLRPAPYLPIIEVDKNLDKGIVLKKGTFVTLDANGFVVPAKKSASALTYGQYDIDYGTLSIDDWANGTKVSATGNSTKTLGPGGDISTGKPIGILMFDVYAWDLGNDPWYQVQDPVTVLADRMVLLAVPESHDAVTYEPGDILVIDDDGAFVSPFNPVFDGEDLAATQTQIANAMKDLKFGVGRVVKVIDLNADADWTAGLENVKYFPPDFANGLPGEQNGGITDGIDETTKKGILVQLWF